MFQHAMSAVALATKPKSSTHAVRSLHVIYDADGTPTGELVYVVKKVLGLAHCAACDITHGPRHEKPEFTALKSSGWTVPLENIHRDEMDDNMRQHVADQLPCVVARTDATDIVIVGPQELDSCAGDVIRFQNTVDSALKRMQLHLVPRLRPEDTATVPDGFPTTPSCTITHSPFVTAVNVDDVQPGDAVVPSSRTR